MEYPEEIYRNKNHGYIAKANRDSKAGWGRRLGYRVGFEAGMLKASDPSTHYSNLTAAIRDNEPIDYEKLDGLNVKCVNPGLRGELHGTLERDPNCSIDRAVGWWNGDVDRAYTSALRDAWDGDNGWTLYIEGDIPLTRKTADQLEVGHLFTGRKLNGAPREYLLCTSRNEEDVLVLWARDFTWTMLQARDWEVIADHGPLQKPEGE